MSYHTNEIQEQTQKNTENLTYMMYLKVFYKNGLFPALKMPL